MIMAASSEAALYLSQNLSPNLYSDPYWLKLLHFKKGRSLAKGKDFFLAPQGNVDPQAELEATVKAFNDPQAKIGTLKLHPQCIFIERYRFLKEKGVIETTPIVCKDFDFWKKGINAKSLTLVFSTAFPNDPSSMFGHTFIRFNQNVEGKNDLLDYGANYSAYIEDPNPNPFVYAYKGIFGGYRGFFGFSPYYMKVNEYINNESRDLYEYDLNIPPENVERLINHLWEVYATTYFNYYFVDENCSYMLGDFIEVAMSKWDLTTIARPFYLPSDLIKKVMSIPQAVTDLHYRPSLKRKFTASLSLLSLEQKKELKDLIEEKKFPRDEKNDQVLDSFLYFKEYESRKNKVNLQGKNQGAFREALMARASSKEKSAELVIPLKEENRPERSHGPQRVSLGGGFDKNQAIMKGTYRLGSHNQMANDDGLEKFSHFEFLSLATSYAPKGKKFKLEEAQLIRLISLFPQDEFDSRLSWTAGGGFEKIREDSCQDCHRFGFDGGLGKTFALTENHWATLMLGNFAEYSTHFDKNLRMGIWGQLQFLGKTHSIYKYKVASKIKTDVLTKWKTHYSWENTFCQTLFLKNNIELRMDSKWWSRLGAMTQNTYEHNLELAYYF